MKKWMVFGTALICLALFAACAREPAQEKVEPDAPEETPGVIVTSIPEEGKDAEKRSIDPGFAAPAPDGEGDTDLAVPAPEGVLDPGFDVLVKPEDDEDRMIVITPESQK